MERRRTLSSSSAVVDKGDCDGASSSDTVVAETLESVRRTRDGATYDVPKVKLNEFQWFLMGALSTFDKASRKNEIVIPIPEQWSLAAPLLRAGACYLATRGWDVVILGSFPLPDDEEADENDSLHYMQHLKFAKFFLVLESTQRTKPEEDSADEPVRGEIFCSQKWTYSKRKGLSYPPLLGIKQTSGESWNCIVC